MSMELDGVLNVGMGNISEITKFFGWMQEQSELVRFRATKGIAGVTRAGTGAVGTPMAGVTGDLAKVMREYDARGAQKLTDAMEHLITSTKEVGDEMVKTEKKKGKLDRNLKETTKTSSNFIKKIVEMTGKLRSVSRLFFYASMDLQQFANVILGPIMQGMTIWIDYEKALAKVFVNVQALGGDGMAALNELNDAVITLSESWEFSRLEIAKAVSVLGQARVPIDDIQESLEDLAGIARVNFLEVDQAAQMTLRIMRQFRMGLEEATSEMWRMSAIAQHTGESISIIVNKMGYATEMGQALGFTFSEIAANMTLLTEKYGTASIAGRRLATVYSQLLQVGEEYGIQLRALDGAMLSNREQISNLADYLDLIGDPLDQNRYLIALFGRTGADAAKTLIEAFKTGKLDEVMKDTGDEMIKVMKDVSDNMKDLTYIGIADLTSGMKDLQMTLASDIAPTLLMISETIMPMVNDITEWIGANEELATGIAALAVAMTALALAIRTAGFMIEIIVALATSVTALAAIASGSGAALLGLGVKMGVVVWVATPLISAIVSIGIVLAIIIAVIILVVGLLYGFIKMVVELGTKMGWLAKLIKVVQMFVGFLIKVLQILVIIVLLVAGAIFKVGEIIGAFIGVIVSLVGYILDLVHAFEFLEDVMRGLNDIADWVLGGLNDLLGVLLPHSPSLADRFLELGESIKGTLGPMQEATMWGRRLNQSVGALKATANIGISGAVGEGVATGMAGAGRGGAIAVNIDGAYIQDPDELAQIMINRTISESKRSYRRGPY